MWFSIALICSAVGSMINSFQISRHNERIKHLEVRIKALEGLSSDDTSLTQSTKALQPESPWGSFLDGLREIGDYFQRPRSREATPPTRLHPRHTSGHSASPLQSKEATRQVPIPQPDSATSVAQLFVAIRAKEDRQAAGQWTDPQVERAVQAATEALVDRKLNETEIVQRVDAALKALEYHAAGWDNVQKR